MTDRPKVNIKTFPSASGKRWGFSLQISVERTSYVYGAACDSQERAMAAAIETAFEWGRLYERRFPQNSQQGGEDAEKADGDGRVH